MDNGENSDKAQDRSTSTPRTLAMEVDGVPGIWIQLDELPSGREVVRVNTQD